MKNYSRVKVITNVVILFALIVSMSGCFYGSSNYGYRQRYGYNNGYNGGYGYNIYPRYNYGYNNNRFSRPNWGGSSHHDSNRSYSYNRGGGGGRGHSRGGR